MRVLLFAVASLAAFAVSGIHLSSASAAPPPESRHVIAVDAFAAGLSAEEAQAAASAVRIIADARPGADLTLMAYASRAGEFSTHPYDSGTIATGLDEFEGLLAPTGNAGRGDQFRAIASTFDFLSDLEAPAGSRLTVITSNGMQDETVASRARLLALVDLFGSQDWTIDTVALPQSSPAAREFLAEIAHSSGGNAYDVGHVVGVSEFVSATHGIKAESIVQTQLNAGAEALAPVEVPPLTDLLKVTAARTSRATRIDVFDQWGAAITNQRPDTRIFETDTAMIFEVTNPEAGRWIARAAGSDAALMIGAEVTNGLQIAFDHLPAPVGEPVLLSARILSNGEAVSLGGAFIEATVTTPAGTSVHVLRDAGVAGDETPGDGVFSVRAPVFTDQLTGTVSLALRWENLGASILAEAALRVEHFPRISIERQPLEPLDLGDQAVVARISVEKAEFPYPIRPELLDVRVLSPDRRLIDSEIVAVDESPDGEAWNFDVLAVPTATGNHSVVANLAGTYLDRPFVSEESISVIEIGIIPPPVPVIIPEPTFMDRIPVWTWGAIALAAVVTIVWAVRRTLSSTQPVPYGYVYDDSGRMLIDFSRTRLSWIQRTFARNRVPASVLPGLSATRGEFVFTREGVQLRTERNVPNLRINGRPAELVTSLADQIRLGVGGRLLTFTLNRPTLDNLSAQPGD